MNSTSPLNDDNDLCHIFYYLVDIVLAGFICTLGTVSNIINLVIFFGSSVFGDNPLVLLLRGLAVTDLVYLLVYGLNHVWPAIESYFGREHYRPAVLYCWAYVWPFLTLAVLLTTWYTVLISIHRYVAVLYPLKVVLFSTHRNILKHMLTVSAAAAVMNIPIFFEMRVQEVIDPDTNLTYKDYLYTDMYNNHYYQLVYKNIIMLSLKKFIPIILISFMSIRIIHQVHRARSARDDMAENPGTQGPQVSLERRVTRTMLSIMITFVICHLPGSVYPIARLVTDVDHDICSVYHLSSQLATAIELVNSAVNIFIYLGTSETYRKEMAKCCCFCCNCDFCCCYCCKYHGSPQSGTLASNTRISMPSSTRTSTSSVYSTNL